MITKLLNEVNEKIETLNNLVQDKEYFEKLDERIEKVNNHIQKQQQEIERLNNIIKEVRENVKGIKEVNNKVYKQKDMLESFYSRKWCEDITNDILEILGSDKE